MVRCRDGVCWETSLNAFEKLEQQYDENNIIDQIEIDMIREWGE